MTSGVFTSTPISDIIVLSERQRKTVDPEKDKALRDSIVQLEGLIHPIVIDEDNVLIAGFRRLSACRELGWTNIPTQLLGDAPPEIQLEIYKKRVENHENAMRRDLTWEENNDYTVAIAELERRLNPNKSLAEIGKAINVKHNTISDHLLVKEFRQSHPQVFDKPDMTHGKAVKEARRLKSKLADDAWVDGHVSSNDTWPSGPIQADFHEWATTYSGPPFNLIHCDFPYGINSQASGANPSGYDDRPEVYFDLLKTLALNLDKFCAPSAHLLFWCSANIEIASNTFQLLKLLDGFTFDEVPLIWVKSDGKGIAPDPQRRFRRVYEIAFFGWRDDRRHAKLKDNAFASPSLADHPHTKPVPVLQHFFEGLVDLNTRLLDPTCGSGRLFAPPYPAARKQRTCSGSNETKSTRLMPDGHSTAYFGAADDEALLPTTVSVRREQATADRSMAGARQHRYGGHAAWSAIRRALRRGKRADRAGHRSRRAAVAGRERVANAGHSPARDEARRGAPVVPVLRPAVHDRPDCAGRRYARARRLFHLVAGRRVRRP